MLSTDTKIFNILTKAQKEGNKLLEKFYIDFPDETINSEINAIYVACANAENHKTGNDFEQFKDLIEIIITTKKLPYLAGMKTIKTTAKEIVRLCKQDDYFNGRLVVRSITPLHDKSTYLIKRGHILLQFINPPESWENSEDTIEEVCGILVSNIEVE